MRQLIISKLHAMPWKAQSCRRHGDVSKFQGQAPWNGLCRNWRSLTTADGRWSSSCTAVRNLTAGHGSSFPALVGSAFAEGWCPETIDQGCNSMRPSYWVSVLPPCIFTPTSDNSVQTYRVLCFRRWLLPELHLQEETSTKHYSHLASLVILPSSLEWLGLTMRHPSSSVFWHLPFTECEKLIFFCLKSYVLPSK